MVSNTSGTVEGMHDYAAFGSELSGNAKETPEPRFKFTGHERDSQAGSADRPDYMHARYCNAMSGRFLSVDPTWESADLGKPQSWNRYSYVLNNPVNMTDPDGKCPDCAGMDPKEAVMALWATFAEFGTEYVIDAEKTGGDLPKALRNGGKRIAGHKKALVQEHYETGTVDKQKMSALDAVRPECPTCSAREGAAMSRYSRTMKNMLKKAWDKILRAAI